MNAATHITRKDLHDSVMLFAAMHGKPTFGVGDFVEFTCAAALQLDQELANELLLEMVSAGFLHEVGPGVYAVADRDAPMALEHPIFHEDTPVAH